MIYYCCPVFRYILTTGLPKIYDINFRDIKENCCLYSYYAHLGEDTVKIHVFFSNIILKQVNAFNSLSRNVGLWMKAKETLRYQKYKNVYKRLKQQIGHSKAN
jgi:hypothetical protein